MSDKANITYNLVEDRNARTAFEQTANEIVGLKRTLANVLSRFNDTGYGAAGLSSVSASVTAADIRETADGLVILTFTFSATLGTASYSSFMVLGKGFPKLATAGAVSYLSAPPSAGSVSCTVLPDGNVMIGTTSAGTGTLSCVATAVWKRR